MRIAIDAMGGDYAPDEIVSGTLEAIEFLGKDDKLVLVGPKADLEAKFPALNSHKDVISLVEAPR